MTDDEDQRECPFCFAPGGECEHYELMVELEKEANMNELVENLSKTYHQNDKNHCH